MTSAYVELNVWLMCSRLRKMAVNNVTKIPKSIDTHARLPRGFIDIQLLSWQGWLV